MRTLKYQLSEKLKLIYWIEGKSASVGSRCLGASGDTRRRHRMAPAHIAAVNASPADKKTNAHVERKRL